ncbi:MAG: sulfotransferase domain-containing protein [Roseobacter sp.]|nr:sulfotransferase domain-containing protein [Roseobacter sp.]
MNTVPARTRDYIGPVTDTRIWDDFDLRLDDVVLSTPPKCGTTWSQAIIMMLLHGRAAQGTPVWKDSHWLDCGFRDQSCLKTQLDAQTHRRCIKSHTPFDGIPFNPDVTYITVYRHPIDLHFSLEKHVANMTSDVLDFMYPSDSATAFDRFLEAPATMAGTDDLTLASFLHHYHSFAKWSHLPNVHMFHYADLTRDIRGQITAYAQVLGSSVPPELLEEIVRDSSFASMKNITRQHKRTDGNGPFADDTKFFDSATSNKWVGRLSESQLQSYRDKITLMAGANDVEWLEKGSSGLGVAD